MTTTPGEFSWKRGFRHAALPVLVFFIGGMGLAASGKVADPEKLGEGCGRFIVFVLAFALGMSYLAQTGRRRAAWLGSLAGVALVAAVAATLLLGSCRANAGLPKGARRPLEEVEIDGAKWLRHPALGFSLRHPGGAYAEAPGMTKIMLAAAGGDAGVHYYAYAEPLPRAVLLIGIVAGGDTQATLREAVDGMTRGITDSARKQMGSPDAAHIDKDEVVWTAEKHEAELRATLAGEVHVRVRAVPLAGRGVFVALTAVGPDISPLDPVLDSLRVD